MTQNKLSSKISLLSCQLNSDQITYKVERKTLSFGKKENFFRCYLRGKKVPPPLPLDNPKQNKMRMDGSSSVYSFRHPFQIKKSQDQSEIVPQGK